MALSDNKVSLITEACTGNHRFWNSETLRLNDLQLAARKESSMFARVVELLPNRERREEFLKTIRIEVLPILKKQPGFLEVLPFLPEIENEKILVVTFWAEKRDVERYVREVFPKVSDTARPYLLSPISSRYYKLETSMCPHLMEALAA